MKQLFLFFIIIKKNMINFKGISIFLKVRYTKNVIKFESIKIKIHILNFFHIIAKLCTFYLV